MIINSEESRDYAIQLLKEADLSKAYDFTLEKCKAKRRTNLQNACLHEYLATMSEALNDAGYDQRATISQLKPNFTIPWTPESLKNLFRTVAKALYSVESTADLSTAQIQDVYRVFDMRLAEISGVSIVWPSRDNQ